MKTALIVITALAVLSPTIASANTQSSISKAHAETQKTLAQNIRG